MNENSELFLRNNAKYLENVRSSKIVRLAFALDPKIRKRFAEYRAAEDTERKLTACTETLNALHDTLLWRTRMRCKCAGEDVRVFLQQIGRRKSIDNSGKGNRDYYSIVLVAKDEARYIRELILFYQATGADRIYLYDNDSSDNLLEEIGPFLKSGLVVYRRYSGRRIQTAAYRDAVRRTRNRTAWLAMVDCDEFLFSPKGAMPEQLRKYEQYPAVGANWVMFGPNGHDRRPEGLIMDNYTTRMADTDSPINCHIKSIVRPNRVFTIDHVHYALYKNKEYAVDENRDVLDCRNAYAMRGGKAFTAHNNREIFRINHYITRSLEDLEEKCRKGYPDGMPNADFEEQMKPFREAQEEDRSIKEYADIVRKKMQNEKGHGIKK